jgi:hypothetical protein
MGWVVVHNHDQRLTVEIHPGHAVQLSNENARAATRDGERESEGNGREGVFGEKGNTEDTRKELT